MHAVTDYVHKAGISAHEGWYSLPSVVSLNYYNTYNFACNSAVPLLFINDSVHFAKLKSRQLQIYSKSLNINIANISCYTVYSAWFLDIRIYQLVFHLTLNIGFSRTERTHSAEKQDLPNSVTFTGYLL